jgi:hypothetical protein
VFFMKRAFRDAQLQNQLHVIITGAAAMLQSAWTPF